MSSVLPIVALVLLTVLSIRQRTRREREHPPDEIERECQRLALYDTAMAGMWSVVWIPRLYDVVVMIPAFWLKNYSGLAMAFLLSIFYLVDYWFRRRARATRIPPLVESLRQ